jgi:signal transduction histidine kinase
MEIISNLHAKISIATVLIGFIFACNIASGQSIKSLEDSLTSSQITIENKIKLHNLLAREYSYVNAVKAIENAEIALDLSVKRRNSIGMANAYRILGSLYAQNDSYFQSLEFFLEALDIFEANEDSLGIANIYVSLGHYYQGLQNHDREIDYHKKSLEIFRTLGFQERIAVATHNLSESYLLAGNYSESRKLAEESVSINRRMKKKAVLSSCYNILGQLELHNGDQEKAKENFEKVLDISNELGENSQKIATVSAYCNLADIYFSQQNYQQMLIYLNKAVEFSKSSLLSGRLTEVYMKLISYYNSIGRTDSVKYFLEEYQRVTADRKNKLNEDRAKLIRSAQEAHYIKQENQELEAFNILQDTRLKFAYTSIVLISVFIIILLWSLVLNIRTKKRLTRQQLTIQKQKERLEELNLTKDKFFSIVAHDLKSPLNSMKGFSDFILTRGEDMSKEDIAIMSGKIKKSIINTLKMADNLINWARIQMQEVKIDRKKLNISETLEPICILYQDLAEKKEITLNYQFDVNLDIYADPDQTAFIMRNLISNAIKFTKRGGFITISAALGDENSVKLKVEDTGVGMPESVKSNLFKLESKYSMKGTDGEIGTGLGLMLCQEFIKLNNGIIEVESEEKKGTTIILTFPQYPQSD